jgi:RNA 3'-terminal phosphate cyclase
MGEGGGQVVRSLRSLSLPTGQPFRLTRIRAKRDRCGLRPQHLAAVQVAAKVCAASVTGDRIGPEAIAFEPGPCLIVALPTNSRSGAGQRPQGFIALVGKCVRFGPTA